MFRLPYFLEALHGQRVRPGLAGLAAGDKDVEDTVRFRSDVQPRRAAVRRARRCLGETGKAKASLARAIPAKDAAWEDAALHRLFQPEIKAALAK